MLSVRLFLLICTISLLHSNELFDHYPLLKEHISYISLGDLPTPVTKLEALGEQFGHNQLYIKRDDLTGALINGARLFGGNKARKLEYLLADALRLKARKVLTVGCAGSNHALATTVYARQVGLEPFLILAPQTNSPVVQRNLLLDRAYGAHITSVHNRVERCQQSEKLKREHGDSLYAIPVGGSVPLGCIGYVNAAFELKKQITEGLLPEPDIIYVACGSGGTTAGLILGIKAAGLKSVIRPIAVDHDNLSAILKKLIIETNELLHATDQTFPLFTWQDSDCAVVTDFVGDGYGKITSAAREAIKLMSEQEHIVLEGTYTAKACAALLSDLASGTLAGKKVLFWNTYSIGDFADLVKGIDYRSLPEELHQYFE